MGRLRLGFGLLLKRADALAERLLSVLALLGREFVRILRAHHLGAYAFFAERDLGDLAVKNGNDEQKRDEGEPKAQLHGGLRCRFLVAHKLPSSSEESRLARMDNGPLQGIVPALWDHGEGIQVCPRC